MDITEEQMADFSRGADISKVEGKCLRWRMLLTASSANLTQLRWESVNLQLNQEKNTQTKRFLYTGQPCALFIWKFWVFLSGVCRNTAYTWWKACSIHLWQVEHISINVKRLFITLWCIHLEQGKSKAADLRSLPGFVVWGAQALRQLVCKDWE